jgi:hypothetical protein
MRTLERLRILFDRLCLIRILERDKVPRMVDLIEESEQGHMRDECVAMGRV